MSPLISHPQGPASRFPFSPWTAGNLPHCPRAVCMTHLLSHLSIPALVCSHCVERGAAPIKLSVSLEMQGREGGLHSTLQMALLSCVR